MIEEWKAIAVFEGLYEVSNFGRVKSLTRYKKILKGGIDKDGYRYVKLKHNYNVKHARICRLVAIAFIPNPNNLPQVNHKDFNRRNDCVNNLEWCTPQGNVQHSANAGHYEKLNTKEVFQLLQGNIVARFESLTDASKSTGVPIPNISKCCNKERLRAGGYEWAFATETYDNK